MPSVQCHKFADHHGSNDSSFGIAAKAKAVSIILLQFTANNGIICAEVSLISIARGSKTFIHLFSVSGCSLLTCRYSASMVKNHAMACALGLVNAHLSIVSLAYITGA